LQIPRISTRGYYDLGSGKTLKTASYFLYPKKSFEKLSGAKEITIMIHGLRNNKKDAANKFAIAQRRLKQLGYKHPVLGFSYDSNTKGAHLKKYELKALRVGEMIARKNGKNLSQFIMDFKKQHPQTKIRLIGHSLGSTVIQSTILNLARKQKNKNIIEGVHFFGASIQSDSLNPKKYGNAFQKIVRSKVTNYYSPWDEVLKYANDKYQIINPLGLYGAKGKTISTYHQIKLKPKNHRFVSYAAVLKKFP
jgi:esterase/lipase superfamily enzyme